MTARRPPGTHVRTPPRARSFPWLASEWGLATVALILAVLVWAVVWGEIAPKEPSQRKIDDFELLTSPGFRAYYTGTVFLDLQGPRGEREKALQALGSPPHLVARVPDLLPGDDHLQIVITQDMVSFPFPTRLVARWSHPRADVYRWMDQQVTFIPPELKRVPEGIHYEITLDPAISPVQGPAGKIGPEIRPDPVDVSRFFQEDNADFLPADQTIGLTFAKWKAEEGERVYRETIDLPEVKALVHFIPVDERALRNRIEFRHKEGFIVTPSTTEESVDQGWWTGLFQGASKDLDKLEELKDHWWFVVNVPEEKLPTGTEEVTANLEIEWAPLAAVRDLRIRFASQTTLIVVIKRVP